MIQQAVYFLLLGLATLTSFCSWRTGVILCMIFDAIRDPFRKVTPHYPLIITLSVAGIWLVTAFGAWRGEPERLRLATRFYTHSRMVGWSIALALMPAAAVSLLNYVDGWLLVLVGVVSYLFPIVGLLVGVVYIRSGRDLFVPLIWYCIANGVILIGAVLEFTHVPLAGLRGMGVHWIRQMSGGLSIDLICGFYRSPDLLGLHSSHVLMFTTIFMMRSRSHSRWLWFPLALFSAWCLLICGRRKMIVMPFFFLAVVMFHGVLRGKMTFIFKAATAAAVVAGLAYMFFPSEGTSGYVQYAETSKHEGWERFSQSGIGGFIEMIRQAGFFGYGLGTATQGSSRLAFHGQRVWSEDGVSRFAAEFGVPGSIFVALAFYGLGRAMWQAVRSLPFDSRASSIQFDFIGVLAANAASFAISHQAFSGDPSSIAVASMSLGYVLALPLLGEEARQAARRKARMAAAAPAGAATGTSPSGTSHPSPAT